LSVLVRFNQAKAILNYRYSITFILGFKKADIKISTSKQQLILAAEQRNVYRRTKAQIKKLRRSDTKNGKRLYLKSIHFSCRYLLYNVATTQLKGISYE
jgi:hypothetical protein